MDDEPLTAQGVAMSAATEQFNRMPTSNPWDYARAIVKALREAGLLTELQQDDEQHDGGDDESKDGDATGGHTPDDRRER